MSETEFNAVSNAC